MRAAGSQRGGTFLSFTISRKQITAIEVCTTPARLRQLELVLLTDCRRRSRDRHEHIARLEPALVVQGAEHARWAAGNAACSGQFLARYRIGASRKGVTTAARSGESTIS
jgi:hypothetical protein